MSLRKVYLGVDIGTSSAKCLAVDEDGSILAMGQQPYPLLHPREGWVEQDPEDYWRGLVESVHQCLSRLGELGRSAEDVTAMAMSTQGGTIILTDGNGNALAPAISWMDGRAGKQLADLISATGAAFWHRSTGSRLTLLSAVPKLRWLIENAPDLWMSAERIAFVPEYLTMRLCGQFVTDTPSASWNPLFSSLERAWSRPVMHLLGIEEDRLARAFESGTVIGELKREAAQELGLTPEVKLVAGAFDQAAAAHGAGAVIGGKSVLSCGTAWVLYSVCGAPSIHRETSIPICCHVSPDEWGIVQPFPGGSTYDWFRGNFIGTGEEGPRMSTKKSPAVEERARGLIFIPHLYGGLAPDWLESSRGSLLGLTLDHGKEDIELALMRGLAFEARRNVEAAERISGPISSIRMVGGATKSRTWPQLIANVLGKPIELSDLTESAAWGAARLAAGEVSGRWDGKRSIRLLEPEPSEAELEALQYRRYLRFLDVLSELYAGS